MKDQIQKVISDLQGEYGDRVRAIQGLDGSISFIVKGEVKVREIKESTLSGVEKVALVLVEATDKRATMPSGTFQVGGISKRTIHSLASELTWRELGKKVTYITVPMVKVMKNNKEVLRLPTAEEAMPYIDGANGLSARAFCTIESFDLSLVMSPSEHLRMQRLLQEGKTKEIQALRDSKLKKAYRRVTNQKTGEVTLDRNKLEVVSALRKVVRNGVEITETAPVYTANILLNGTEDVTADGQELDAFYVYRAIKSFDGISSSVKYVRGGISEEARLLNDMVAGVSEGEQSIPAGNLPNNASTTVMN